MYLHTFVFCTLSFDCSMYNINMSLPRPRSKGFTRIVNTLSVKVAMGLESCQGIRVAIVTESHFKSIKTYLFLHMNLHIHAFSIP